MVAPVLTGLIFFHPKSSDVCAVQRNQCSVYTPCNIMDLLQYAGPSSVACPGLRDPCLALTL